MSARDNHLLEVRLALPSHSSLSGLCLPALWARVGSLRFPTAFFFPPSPAHVSSHIRPFTLFLSCKSLSFSLVYLSGGLPNPGLPPVLPPTRSSFISCYLLRNKCGSTGEFSRDKHRDTSDCWEENVCRWTFPQTLTSVLYSELRRQKKSKHKASTLSNIEVKEQFKILVI